MCVYVCTEIFGKQQASVWKPFFLLGTMHGILLVLGRRSKNKRWVRFCFHRLRLQKDRSWQPQLETQDQQTIICLAVSKKLWRQQETEDFKAYYSSTKSKAVSLFKSTRLPRWHIERDCYSRAFVFRFRFLCVATTVDFCQATVTI